MEKVNTVTLELSHYHKLVRNSALLEHNHIQYINRYSGDKFFVYTKEDMLLELMKKHEEQLTDNWKEERKLRDEVSILKEEIMLLKRTIDNQQPQPKKKFFEKFFKLIK